MLLAFYAVIRRSSFELETVAFFLCTLGMAVICTVKPGETVKQVISLGLGILFYLLVGWSLRDLERAKQIRYYATIAGIGLLVTVISQILNKAGREDLSTLTAIAGLVIVLIMVVSMVDELLQQVQSIFNFVNYNSSTGL